MGGFCQRLITAVCSTHRRDRDREAGTHTKANRLSSVCMHTFHVKAAAFRSYVMYMGKERLKNEIC